MGEPLSLKKNEGGEFEPKTCAETLAWEYVREEAIEERKAKPPEPAVWDEEMQGLTDWIESVELKGEFALRTLHTGRPYVRVTNAELWQRSILREIQEGPGTPRHRYGQKNVLRDDLKAAKEATEGE